MDDSADTDKVVKTICGPYDQQFLRKFRGRQVKSLSVERLKLLRVPVQKTHRYGSGPVKEQNMLPKLKELEKIAKMERKKAPRMHKYLDGISDLELYITNKLMNNQSTRDIVGQLSRNIRDESTNQLTVNNNYMRMTVSGAQSRRFHELEGEGGQGEGLKQMVRTDYTGKGKWVSDREFVRKFDRFIVTGRKEEEVSAKETVQSREVLTEKEAVERIATDKQNLTRIAKKMIADQVNYTQEQDLLQQANSLLRSQKYDDQFKNPRNINWILRQCSDYQKKFKIGKVKTRGKGKSCKR